MKHFIVSYNHNYGTSVMFVNALNEKEAIILAKLEGAWETAEAIEVDLNFRGVTYIGY